MGNDKMMTTIPKTFIVDCSICKAKVAAIEHGSIKQSGCTDYEGDVHYGTWLFLGVCPKCNTILVGESQQIGIEGIDSEYDEWAEVIRVYPEPAKTFVSKRIPKSVSESISEAGKCLQVNANIAACAMFGRVLEAICRDLLEPAKDDSANTANTPSKRPVMLGEGINKLKENGHIDQRLFDWSQQLHAFRNMAAHPTDTKICRKDAEDLGSFVYAIIEYIYDLTDRYNELKDRIAKT